MVKKRLTAHLTPIIQVPPMTSPFFLTALRASPGFPNPNLKQLVICEWGVAWVVSLSPPSDLKYSRVAVYLSGGYPNTITNNRCESGPWNFGVCGGKADCCEGADWDLDNASER